ncbi:MAG: RNA methyltransferase [Clostridia bacterium]|nr:RNA methyltransferase [Clostridia bacterium]
MTREECIARYRAEELRSRTGATVTMLSKLKDAKYREEYGLYLAEGVKLAEEALTAGMEMEMLFVSEDGLHSERILACLDAADAKRIPIKLATAEVFEKAATEKAPQGIIAVLHRRKTEEPFRDPEARYFLLDTIQDPGNLGTILRSAVAFGADGLILCGCADPTGPKTVRASMGALFRCPVQITKDLGETIRQLQKDGHRVLAAALGENSLCAGQAELQKNDCVIIGNEGHGVSQDNIDLCDGVIRIPMQAVTESLNASVAASVLLWEYYRTFGV